MAYIIKDRKPAEPWRDFRAKAVYRWMIPFVFADWICDQLADRLSKWALPELLEYAGAFSVLVGVVLYFTETGQRREQRHFQAWQVINTAQGKGGNGGRIDALQDLNDDHVSLIAVDLSTHAYLYGLRLPGAQLRRGLFMADDMRTANLHGAGLQQADMESANLRNANLGEADFTDANLKDTDLTDADLTGATLTDVDLSDSDLPGANLAGVKDWQSIRDITGANIHGIQNAPDGFVKWALENGATDGPSTQPATSPHS